MLMQFWGGLPYVDEVLPSDEVLKRARLTYRETADKASEDFRKAAALLPLDWTKTTVGKQTVGKNNIRINKIMALAYLGKNELQQEALLMSGDVNAQTTAYNAESCQRAADAFAEVLDLCDKPSVMNQPTLQIIQIFSIHTSKTENSRLKEAIFYENLADASGSRYRWNQVNDYVSKTLIQSGIKHYPTANYVDYYGTNWLSNY